MYKKIYIVGVVGSGKTTLSKKLSKKYNIQRYELDKIVWDDDNGNVKRTDEEIEKRFNEIIKQDEWIIEDVGRKRFVKGIKEADIVYYIELSKINIYFRCISRWIKQRLGKEEYNYKPTIKSLFTMFYYAKEDFKKKKGIIENIKNTSKKYVILNKKDLEKL